MVTKTEAAEKLKKRLEAEPLPVTPELRKILDSYFYEFAYKHYSARRLNEWAYKYMPMFIRWLAKRRGRDLAISDFEGPALRPEEAEKFAEDLTESRSMRTQINATLAKFAGWLEERYYVKIRPMRGIKMYKRKGRGDPRIYSYEELKKIFTAIDFIKDEIPRRQYRIFGKLMLQSGLRTHHAWLLACATIKAPKTVESILGDIHYPINALRAVEHAKELMEEEIEGKMVAELIYLHDDLYDDIKAWCKEKEEWGGRFDRDIRRFLYDTIEKSVRERLIGESEERIKKEIEKKIKDLVEDKLRRVIPAEMRSIRSEELWIRRRTGIEDFTWYSFRDTFASVYYNIVGKLKPLTKRGGWEESGKIPLQYYIDSMDDKEALDIARDFHIYIEPEHRGRVSDIQRREYPEERITKEEYEELFKEREKERGEKEKLEKEREEMESRLRKLEEMMEELVKK